VDYLFLVKRNSDVVFSIDSLSRVEKLGRRREIVLGFFDGLRCECRLFRFWRDLAE